MEYLVTYGWTILIIAVVLGALYALGIFNSVNLSPKASPGACQAVRPDGPGTSFDISLQGDCNNQLPQTVASFDGQSGYMEIPSSQQIMVGDPSFTFSAWVDPASLAGCTNAGYPYCIIFNKEGSYEWALYSNGQLGWALQVHGSSWYWVPTNVYVPTGSWSNIVLTYDGSNVIAYIDGSSNSVTAYSGAVDNIDYQNALRIGARGAPGAATSFFNGEMSNIQIYNTSLSATHVKALYTEGIGGDPIEQQHLEGWWPLNGNGNDYSGNNDNGRTSNTGITYVSGWSTDYAAP